MYNTNNLSFSPTNILRSNILAGTAITITVDGWGRLTLNSTATGTGSTNIWDDGELIWLRNPLATNSFVVTNASRIAIAGFDATATYVWTCTNSTTGEGHWAEAPGAGGGITASEGTNIAVYQVFLGTNDLNTVLRANVTNHNDFVSNILAVARINSTNDLSTVLRANNTNHVDFVSNILAVARINSTNDLSTVLRANNTNHADFVSNILATARINSTNDLSTVLRANTTNHADFVSNILATARINSTNDLNTTLQTFANNTTNNTALARTNVAQTFYGVQTFASGIASSGSLDNGLDAVYVTNLTASKIVLTDANKKLVSSTLTDTDPTNKAPIAWLNTNKWGVLEPQNNEVLKYRAADGVWTNQADATGAPGAGLTNAYDLADSAGVVINSNLNVGGLVYLTNLTASKLVLSDANKKLVSSTLTDTDLATDTELVASTNTGNYITASGSVVLHDGYATNLSVYTSGAENTALYIYAPTGTWMADPITKWISTNAADVVAAVDAFGIFYGLGTGLTNASGSAYAALGAANVFTASNYFSAGLGADSMTVATSTAENFYPTNVYLRYITHTNTVGGLPIPTNAPASNKIVRATSSTTAEWMTYTSGGDVVSSGDNVFSGSNRFNGILATSNTTYFGTLLADLPTPGANTFPKLYCTDVITSRGLGGEVQWDGANWRTRENIISTVNLTNFVLNASAASPFLVSPISTIILGSGFGLTSGGYSILPRTQGGSGGSGNWIGAGANGGFIAISTGSGATGSGALVSFGEQAMQTGDIYAWGGLYCAGQSAPDGTDNYWAAVGFSSLNTGVVPSSGAFFLYDQRTNTMLYGTVPNAATAQWTNNWICVTAKTGTGTNYTDSGLPVTISTTALNDRLLVIATTTAVLFYTNGVLAATHTASIPTVTLWAGANCTKTLGTNSRKLYEAQPYIHLRHAARTTPY